MVVMLATENHGWSKRREGYNVSSFVARVFNIQLSGWWRTIGVNAFPGTRRKTTIRVEIANF